MALLRHCVQKSVRQPSSDVSTGVSQSGMQSNFEDDEASTAAANIQRVYRGRHARQQVTRMVSVAAGTLLSQNLGTLCDVPDHVHACACVCGHGYSVSPPTVHKLDLRCRPGSCFHQLRSLHSRLQRTDLAVSRVQLARMRRCCRQRPVTWYPRPSPAAAHRRRQQGGQTCPGLG